MLLWVLAASYKTGYYHGRIVGAEFTHMVIHSQDEQYRGKDAKKGPKDVDEIANRVLRPVWVSMAKKAPQQIWQSVTRIPRDPWIQIGINVEVPFRELRCHCRIVPLSRLISTS